MVNHPLARATQWTIAVSELHPQLASHVPLGAVVAALIAKSSSREPVLEFGSDDALVMYAVRFV